MVRRPAADAARTYAVWGLVSGSIYGALGAVWASRPLVLGPVAVGLAFLCEPLIVFLLWRAGIWGDGGLLLHYPWMWSAEMLLGLAGIAYAVARASARPARAGRVP